MANAASSTYNSPDNRIRYGQHAEGIMVFLEPILDILLCMRVESCVSNWLCLNLVEGLVVM
jgi:hypothetical protein